MRSRFRLVVRLAAITSLAASMIPSEGSFLSWLEPARARGQSVESASGPADDLGMALDRRFEKLTIDAQPVGDALAELGRRAGLRIIVDDEALELLPWGRQTRFSEVTIEDATLRDALTQVLGALGMTYVERDGALVAVLTKPLRRISNRRATWDDLKLVREMMQTEFTPEAFAKYRIQFKITSQLDPPKMLNEQFAKAGRGTIAQVLEVALASLGWTWFPEGDHLVVISNQAAINHRLSRRLTFRFNNMPLSKILVDLCARADVALELQPGLMLKLPANVAQNYTLSLHQSSIREALEVIAAETGVKYEVTRDLIRFSLSDEALGDAAAAARRAGGYVGKITVPSKDGTFAYEFLVRENEFPKDILEYRQQIIESTVEKIRAEMAPDASIKPAPPAGGRN